jgi:hypothetical protein
MWVTGFAQDDTGVDAERSDGRDSEAGLCPTPGAARAQVRSSEPTTEKGAPDRGVL